jgi:hypothetical protein
MFALETSVNSKAAVSNGRRSVDSNFGGRTLIRHA